VGRGQHGTRKVLIEGVEEAVEFRPQPSACVGGGAQKSESDGDGDDDGDGGGGGAFRKTASKLFVLGRGLAVGTLRRDFQFCRVPPGYSFAADVELDFVPRLTAASTATSGVAKRLRAVESSMPGVTIVRVVGARGGDGEGGAGCRGDGDGESERYFALGRTPPSEPEDVEVLDDAQHGVCVRFVPLRRSRAPEHTGGPDPQAHAAEAAVVFRVSDGGALPAPPHPDPAPAATAGTSAAAARPQEVRHPHLRRLPVVFVEGAIYVREHGCTINDGSGVQAEARTA
jgi:hypothetical protein